MNCGEHGDRDTKACPSGRLPGVPGFVLTPWPVLREEPRSSRGEVHGPKTAMEEGLDKRDSWLKGGLGLSSESI